MKKVFTLTLLVFLTSVYSLAQTLTAVIKVEAMSDYRVRYELKKSVTLNANRWTSTGLPVAAPKTVVWLSGSEKSGAAITSYSWTLDSKPSGSNATINDATSKMMNFVPDVVGTYVVKLTINGTAAATQTIYCGTYRGVGTITNESFTAGTPDPSKLQCGMCHSNVVPNWAKTRHASIFKKGITGQLEFTENYEGISNPGGQYASTCAPCHTTGYNSGFDNTQASSTGFLSYWWANGFTKPDTSGSGIRKMFSFDGSRWTSMSTEQKQFATIGCEACHGPYYSEHMSTAKGTNVTIEDGACDQCHDAPYKHSVTRQFMNSRHSSMTAYTSDNASCNQCHSGKAFYEFVEARSQSKTPSLTGKNNSPLACTICHDPHSTTNEKQVRTVNADTLANGYKIVEGGLGKICMNCHKARSDAQASVVTKYTYSTRLGPHHGPQADVFLGRNAIEYNENYKYSITGLMSHEGVENSCATCHMYPSPDVYGSLGYNNPGINQMGGHTFKLKGYKFIADGMNIKTTDSTIIEHVAACKECHGEITDFGDIKAFADYDGDDVLEGVQAEIEGLLAKLESKLLAAGLTKGSNGWVTLRATNTTKADSILLATNMTVRKAYYNYIYFKEDRSLGAHNAKYTINVLLRTLNSFSGTGGVVQNDINKPAVYSLSPNYPNPFNPTTNINFTVPKDGNVKINIYNINGQLVATLVDNFIQSGTYTVTWDGRTNNGTIASSGVYFYQMRAPNFVMTKKMTLMK